MLRFFHRPLLIAHLAEYEYTIENKKITTIEYKIKKIIKDITDKDVEVKVWHSGIHTPELSENGFKATAIYLPIEEELLIIYRGSELSDISDWYYNYTGIVSGENTSQLDSALQFVNYIKNELVNFNRIYKVAAGHSLGGHLAISVELIIKKFQRVYTYNTALPQLKQLRKYDEKFEKSLHDYFLEKDLEDTIKLEEFATNYYSEYAHHIYNYLRKNDFINSLSMTVGTFKIGKTIEFPPLLAVYLNPYDYLTIEDTYILDELLGSFYKYLFAKNIRPDNIVENQEKLGEEFISYITLRIKEPLQSGMKKSSIYNMDISTKLKESYAIFRALYNYMVYLAHSGIIPDDILIDKNSNKINTMYEEALANTTLKSLKNILKPLQDFYALIRAFNLLSKAKEFEDIKSWAEIAKAHDLSAMYDEL